jgi:RNA polymerase sigma-70 factor (ECF subfamily)
VTLNKWRQWRRRRPEATFENSEALDAVAAPDEMAAFEEAEYCRQLVRQALHALRDVFSLRTWEAFRLYAVEGQEAEAVAAALQVSVGTVYAAKSRVLARLRRELKGLLD